MLRFRDIKDIQSKIAESGIKGDILRSLRRDIERCQYEYNFYNKNGQIDRTCIRQK